MSRFMTPDDDIIEVHDTEPRVTVIGGDGTIRCDTLAKLRADAVPNEVIVAGAKGDKFSGRIAELYALARGEMDKVTAPYADAETAHWTELVMECNGYKNDGAYNGQVSPYLAAVTAPENLRAYVDGVLAKSAEYKTRLAQIVKNRDVHYAAIMALTTPEDVLSYDLATGW